MIDNTNVSNVCLNECKEQMRMCITESSLNINCDDTINTLTQEIDIRKFKTWYESNINNFKSKTNPNSYFKKAFLSELAKGTFKPLKKRVDATTLASALRSKGIAVSSDNALFIELMWQEIYELSGDENLLIELNHKILDYMKADQTFEDYVSLVKRSKAVKAYTVDWEKIQKKYSSLLDSWEKMIEGAKDIYEGQDE